MSFFDNSERGRVIEWTLDKYWESWNTGYVVETWDDNSEEPHLSNSGRYGITVPKEAYQEIFGDGPGHGWLRVSDRNRNSVVQRFDIPGIVYPRIDTAAVYDAAGDGIADSLHVSLIPPDSEDDAVFSPTDFIRFEYSWPSSDNLYVVDEHTDIHAGDTWISVANPDLTEGYGTGEIEIEFPSREDPTWVDEMLKTLHGDVLDRVGPAVSTEPMPEYIPGENGADDMLHITLSEPVEELVSSAPHLALRDASGTERVVETKDVSYDAEANRFSFSFPAGLLAEYNFVRLNPAGPVRDLVGNPPAKHTQWVPYAGGNEPQHPEFFLQNTEGDGRGDELIMRFSIAPFGEDPFTEEHINEISYTIGETSVTMSPDENTHIDTDEEIVTLTVSVDYPGDAQGTGTLSFYNPATDEWASLEEDIEDRVGPAVSKGENIPLPTYFIEYGDFVLSFTEALTELNAGVSHLEFMDSEDNIHPLETKAISSDNEIYTFRFSNDLAAYDSVRIIPGGAVEDAVGNSAAENNRWVPLRRQGDNEPTPGHGAIIDTEGDGRGDRFSATFIISSTGDNPFTDEHIQEVSYTIDRSDERILKESSWEVQRISEDNDTVHITVDERDYGGAKEGTMRILFDRDDTDPHTLTIALADRVGPALTGVMCLQEDEDRDRDTLFFDVSEALADDISSEGTYFYIYKGAEDGPQKALAVEEFSHVENTRYGAMVDRDIIDYGDWIHFIHDSGIQDPVGNPPLEINQKIEIDVR
ncbi:hypothetical protein, partial [Chitinivibrio alkaliphilus]|uniref:hypothetical protein n=1 Tax=Chitinivibrio alkaliphilus TaxID=1505232 RepID=UPI00055569BB